MNRKTMFIALISVTLVVLAVNVVTARSSTPNTPLYTVRMEQVSSKMNFLPTQMNAFTYTTENRYTLDFKAPVECCGRAEPLDHCTEYETTCAVTCDTCVGQYTCAPTSCQPTCPVTCEGTCYITCGTCSTCQGFQTCDYTCWLSCEGNTCNTCDPKCWPPP